jgi:heme-degrading monooxygenase HmoA
MNNSKTNAIELVIFKTKPEFDQKDVKASLESLTAIVSNYKGFISRQLAKNEEGKWMDLVFWESMEDAKAAADEIMKLESAQKAFSVIDEQTMEFYHFDPISRYPVRNE